MHTENHERSKNNSVSNVVISITGSSVGTAAADTASVVSSGTTTESGVASAFLVQLESIRIENNNRINFFILFICFVYMTIYVKCN